jgi:hypothetical protein
VFSPLKEFLYPYYTSSGDLGGKCAQEAMKIYCEKHRRRRKVLKECYVRKGI